MTGFRQSSGSLLCLLLLCLFLTATVDVVVSDARAAELSVPLAQENAELKRKLRRLEHQVSALRDELNSPDSTQIVGGIGYIVGVFGIAGWLAARKKQRQEN